MRWERRMACGAALALAATALAGLSGDLPIAAPATPDELYAQGDRLLESGQMDQAVARFQEALAMDPKHWRSLCRLGEIHAASQRYADAEHLLKAAVEVNPDAGPCHSRLAQVLLVNNKLSDAERALVRAAQLLPADEVVLFNLARLYDNTGRPDLAVETYRKHLALAPDSSRAPSAHLKVARRLAETGQQAGALDHYHAYLKAQPERHEVRAEMAAYLMRSSRYDEALQEYERIIAAGAADAQVLSSAGSICMLLQKMPRALELLERAVAADLRSIPARIALASALAHTADHSRAVEVLRGVTADDPENNRAYFLLGQSLMKLGQTDQAREALARHQAIHEKIMKERMSGDPQAHP